jgi:hypothetical protein
MDDASVEQPRPRDLPVATERSERDAERLGHFRFDEAAKKRNTMAGAR